MGLQMKQFCDERDGCRHKALLTYFGEAFEAGRCRGNCDNCARQARGEAADAPDPDWLVSGLPNTHRCSAVCHACPHGIRSRVPRAGTSVALFPAPADL